MHDQEIMGWVAVVLMPFVGAFHRYSIAYGYQGDSRDEACRKAIHVFWILVVWAALITGFHLVKAS